MIEEQKGASEAESILEDLGFSSLPINPLDVVDAISSDDFKVVLETKNLQSNKILGKAVGNEKGALIYINANIPDQRRANFTAAHEVGHVCMHIMPSIKMDFECGARELTNSFDDPIEKQANGFASGLLLPRNLIHSVSDSEINWTNISSLSEASGASLEATYRRMSFLSREPSAMLIHQKGRFKRFVASDNFEFYINRPDMSVAQMDLAIDTNEEGFPSDFDEVDASDWVNPNSRAGMLESIYSSTVILNDGFSYTLLTYDDDCMEDC